VFAARKNLIAGQEITICYLENSPPNNLLVAGERRNFNKRQEWLAKDWYINCCCDIYMLGYTGLEPQGETYKQIDKDLASRLPSFLASCWI
jgi:hypothetical protein